MSVKHATLQARGGGPGEMERDEKGHFIAKKGRKVAVAELARSIIEDSEALETLKSQAKNGVGSAPEQLPPAVWTKLAAYAWGEPRKRSDDEDEEFQKWREARAAVSRFLKEQPDKARVIDLGVQKVVAGLRPLPPAGEGDVA